MSDPSKCECCERDKIFLNYTICNGCLIFMKIPLESFTQNFIDLYKKGILHFHVKKVKNYKIMNEYKTVKEDKVREKDNKKERDNKSKITEKKIINPEQIYLNL